MERAEVMARNLVSQRSTDRLVEDFETTETVNDLHISTVRGWIMDELKKRDPEAFDRWIESFEESPRRFFIKA